MSHCIYEAMEGIETRVVQVVQESLESLRSSLLGELQEMRARISTMEEKVDCVLVERCNECNSSDVGLHTIHACSHTRPGFLYSVYICVNRICSCTCD